MSSRKKTPPGRAKVRMESKDPRVLVQGTPAVEGKTGSGRNWTRKGRTTRAAQPYPVKVCQTQYRDPTTGRIAPNPNKARPAGRAQLRKGTADGGLILINRTVDREVMGSKVIDTGMRAAQRRGKVRKADVRDHEKELSRDLLRHKNPQLADSVDLERMHEAHRSDKARRGAATRKVRARTRKHRPEAAIRADVLKVQADLKEVRRKLSVAITIKQNETLRKRERNLVAKAAKLRREEKAAGL
ncbi:hypothetical protein [Deinococcus soli (ex Cha et al. 2016)]|uniref:hypothetical protein n=1 Tax=Deinococcus soli (ex Cha et al. 2016) TaxID=1309411 RepID=UPI00166AE269|nr:hypothetical protein [Deinococcus soli (ex Cha et al. 2016)]GGB80437.1 hypothetical protein GCM10008019_40840 [Deinococcus soli (ex Cha et al. 2016)]